MTKRNQALDVFRGLTIFFMFIVNSLPSSSNLLFLKHAKWNGCTIADLVFPFFLFILGFTHIIRFSNTHPSASSIIKRCLELIAIGLFLNAFPMFHKFRVPGVLQRIAICYVVIDLLHQYCRPKTQILLLFCILVSYYLFNLYFPTNYLGHLLPGMRFNHIGYVDQILFTPKHLLSPYFDPEGLISTIPAIGSTILGALIAYHYQKKPRYFIVWLIVIGGLCFIIAYYWQAWCPLNKSIWSSSFVLWTTAMACWTFACLMCLCHFKNLSYLFSPLAWLGRHSLTSFIISTMIIKVLYVL
jgi:predicted acyltransferase